MRPNPFIATFTAIIYFNELKFKVRAPYISACACPVNDETRHDDRRHARARPRRLGKGRGTGAVAGRRAKPGRVARNFVPYGTKFGMPRNSRLSSQILVQILIAA